MNKIFIDGGAHKGESLKAFLTYYPDDPRSYDVYSFEANPILIDNLQDIVKGTGIELIEKAIWTGDGYIDFYSGASYSGTLMRNKTTGNLDINNPVSVESIDFSKWVKDTFSDDDYIILKLDIEGGEYDVLEKMIDDGNIKYIDKLYVEWHAGKLDGFDMKRHDKLIEVLNDEYNLEPKYWWANKILREKRFSE